MRVRGYKVAEITGDRGVRGHRRSGERGSADTVEKRGPGETGVGVGLQGDISVMGDGKVMGERG